MRPPGIVLPVVMLLLPALAPAQRFRDARTAVSARVALDSLTERPDARPDSSDVLFKRTLAGFGGTLIGGTLGFLGGYVVYGTSHHVSCGEFCIPTPIAIGTLAGVLVGTALGVTIPAPRRDCSRQLRFTRGLVGSVAGLVAGGALLLTEIGGLAFPVMPALGAALAQGRC